MLYILVLIPISCINATSARSSPGRKGGSRANLRGVRLCCGIVTAASIVVVRRKSMYGSPVNADTKKHRETQRSILVRASKPYVQQYSVLHIRNAQSRALTMEKSRERLVGDCEVLS